MSDISDSPTGPPAGDAPPQTQGATPPLWGRSRIWKAVAIGGVLIALGIWFVASKLPDYLTRSDGTTAAAPAGEGRQTSDARRIQATLFYVSEDGTSLVPVTREVVFGATPAEQARRIVEAQIETPDGMVSAIPAGTTVRGVYLTETHEAYVDLGGAVTTGHTGGSLDEALAVYAIVNAITFNLPDV